MRLRLLRELAARLALQARQNQPRKSVAHAAREKILVRMIGRYELFDTELLDRPRIGLDLNIQHLRPLAAIDRQHAMRRHPGQRLAKIQVVVELLILLRVVFYFRTRQLPALAEQLANLLPE